MSPRLVKNYVDVSLLDGEDRRRHLDPGYAGCPYYTPQNASKWLLAQQSETRKYPRPVSGFRGGEKANVWGEQETVPYEIPRPYGTYFAMLAVKERRSFISTKDILCSL